MKKHGFIIQGNYYEINLINNELDNLFINLHNAYLGKEIFDWHKFKKATFSYFQSMKKKNKEEKTKLQKQYLNNFNNIWSLFVGQGHFYEAEKYLKMILNLLLDWEEKYPNDLIHKGGPYYFWGMTEIKSGNLEKGYALMHKALQEDIRTMEDEYPQTPALWFATADYSKVNQAFREWPLRQAEFLNKKIEVYCQKYMSSFVLDDFREKFLCEQSVSDIIYIFSFNISKLFNIHSSVDDKSKASSIVYKSDFAGQWFLDIFFNLALIIDKAIHEKNISGYNFLNNVEFLSDKLNLGITVEEWGDINVKLKKSGLGTTLETVLDKKLFLKNKSITSLKACDIAVAYSIRNYAGHNIKSNKIVRERFLEIEQSLFNTLFITVQTLYM